MSELEQLTPAQRRRGLAAVTVALAVASLLHGLTLPMFALVLEDHGVQKSIIGINATAQYLAVFAAAPFASRLMRTIGPVAVMFWSVLVAALIFFVLPIHVDVWLWFGLRFTLGIGQSFLWIAGEAWISHLAEDHRRGRIIAIYGVVTACGFAAGPLLLSVLGAEGWGPFFVAADLMLAAALPLAVIYHGAPRLPGRQTGSFLRYAFQTPVATWAYLAFAAGDAMLLTFLPIYATHAGLPQWIGITLLTSMAVGSIVSQYPIGHLADRMNGMMLTSVSLIALIITVALIPLAITHTPLNFVVLFLFGCTLGALYTLPLVFIGRRFKGADLAPATTARSIVFCVGAIIGPPIAGTVMQVAGSDGLPWSLVVLFLLVLPLPIIGWRRNWIA